jgi:hypothetical protein
VLLGRDTRQATPSWPYRLASCSKPRRLHHACNGASGHQACLGNRPNDLPLVKLLHARRDSGARNMAASTDGKTTPEWAYRRLGQSDAQNGALQSHACRLK